MGKEEVKEGPVENTMSLSTLRVTLRKPKIMYVSKPQITSSEDQVGHWLVGPIQF